MKLKKVWWKIENTCDSVTNEIKWTKFHLVPENILAMVCSGLKLFLTPQDVNLLFHVSTAKHTSITLTQARQWYWKPPLFQ